MTPENPSTVPSAALPARPGWAYYAAWAAALAALTWAWNGAEIRPGDLVHDSANMVSLGREFFPPDFHDWRLYLDEMLVTVQIAVWGTVLAVLCAVPGGLLCSANIVPPWIYQPARRMMDALRSINEMVFAMLFIVAVGLGPFAGVLALWVHTTGVLSKLFAEAVEAIDIGPVEAVRTTGANWLEVIRYGVIPQVLPLWTSFAMYRFESNVRSASVVGMVGAGGIGVILYEMIRSFEYAQTAAILLIVVVAVTTIDLVSARVRAQLM